MKTPGFIFIRLAKQSGGKAGKGRNRTSTYQVVTKHDGGGCTVHKSFRFTVGNLESQTNAYGEAYKFIRGKES